MLNNIIYFSKKLSLVCVLLVPNLVCASQEIATTKESNKTIGSDNTVDTGYQTSKGWNYYFDAKSDADVKKMNSEIEKEPASKKKELDLLQKILDENRKQTKIQEKILSILEEELDPKPKEVVVNGKKCVANSSAECFVYPMIAEAKRVPAMAEFLKDPYDIKKAGQYLKWQATLFNHAINIGNSLQFAHAQFGEEAYPIAVRTPSYTSAGGLYEAKILPEAEKELILKHKHELSYSIFIGKNITVDIYSALSVSEIIEQYGEMDIEIIYYDEKAKSVFEGAIASVYDMSKRKNWTKVKRIVDPKMFDTFKITTSPSFVIKKVSGEKEKKEAQTILTGKVDSSSFRSRTIAFMELKKMIDYEKFNQSAGWDSKAGKEAVVEHYKSTQNVDIKNLVK